MQAQDFLGALWSIGLRTSSCTQRDVLAALDTGSIVRSWPMRGTLHFMAREDVRWWMALTAPRALAAAAKRHQDLELDAPTMQQSRRVVERCLQGGRGLTRLEVAAALEKAGISTAGQRGYHILWTLAHTGVLCFGPVQGKQQSFVLVDEWVPPVALPDRDSCLSTLALRYFASHGPATVADFAWWTGLKTSDARRAIDMAKLPSTTIAGTLFWLGADPPPSTPTSQQGLLLPGFDEYFLGYTDRSPIVDSDQAKKLAPGNGMFSPTVVVHGHVEGTWRRTLQQSSVRLQVQAFNPPVELDVAAAATRYGHFLGLEVVLGADGATKHAS
jgi:hypothetical protein